MKRRYAILSILVTGVLGLVLITPEDKPQQKPQKVISKASPKPVRKLSIQMATVSLPPPPVLKTPTPKSIIPMVAQTAPEVIRAPLPSKATKTSRIKPLAPMPAVATKKTEISTKPMISNIDLSSQHKPVQKSPVATTYLGRPLLKLLEFGKGPSIEIAWPDRSSDRAKLFDVFRQCYGMRIALMNEAGNLYDDQSTSGAPWHLNTDRFSGFVRQSQGRAADAEISQINSIREHHGLYGGNAVRLFPRETDALLLGGLQSLIGSSYTDNQTIRARYQISGRRVQVGNIFTDGQAIDGTVDLSAAATAGCRL